MTAFFVFGVTFGLAWIFGAAIPALLSLIPVVLLTIFTASILTNFTFSDSYVSRDLYTSTTPIIWLISYLIALVAVGLVAWRTGSRSFVAPGGRSIKRTVSAGLAYRPESNFFRYKRSGETGALLWQAWMQNRTMILAMIVIAFASWFFVANAGGRGLDAALTSFSVGSYALLVCWVGTMAFGADQHLRRVHFLAERGISPVKVWVSRLAVPFGVLVLLALTVLAIELFKDTGYQNPPQTMQIACLLAALWSFVAVSIAQWWGQLGFSRVVILCGAPLSVVLLMAYYASIVSMFIAPIWLVLLMLPLPFLATRISMRAWMDRRFTVSYYVRHGLFLVAALVSPLIPFGFQLATVPRISSANQQLYLGEYKQFLAADSAAGDWSSFWRFEAKELPFQITVPAIEVLIQKYDSREADNENGLPNGPAFAQLQSATLEADPSPNIDGQESAMGIGLEGPGGAGVPTVDPEALERQFRLETLKGLPSLSDIMEELVTKFEEALDRNPGALRYSVTIQQIEIEAIQKGFAVAAKPDEEKIKKRWESSVRLLGKIATALRKSVTILDQNHADHVEQTILQILQTDIAKQSLDQNLYQSLVSQIANIESRKRSRKRALLYSWQNDTQNFRSDTDRIEFQRQLGGVDLYGFRRDKILKQTFIAKTQRDRIVDLLIQYATANDDGTQRNIQSELEETLTPEITNSIVSSWHGDWEKQAASLSKP
jgi:hypothetical protein